MIRTARLTWDESWLERSIAERFRLVAEHFGGQEAVVDEQRRLTYAQLDEWSSTIEQAVLRHRDDRLEPVLILAGHSCLAIAALLGVLRAGKFYSIVDAQQPTEWLTAIAADLRPALILFDEASSDQGHFLATQVGCPALDLETLLQEQSHEDVYGSLRRQTHPTDLAMVVFTSGTTGKPKGVMISQRAIMARGVATLNRGEIFHNARVLLILSLTFGFGITNTFGSLLNGATLVLARGNLLRVAELVRIIQQETISSVAAPPSLLRNLLPGLESGREMLNLRYLATGGERLFYDDVVRWQKIIPPTAIFEYRIASTETIGAYASLRLDRTPPIDGETIPVGYPPPEVEIWLVDEHLQPVAPGEPGQIAVRKDFMAEGYWRQPELTAQRFLPDPEGGNRRVFLTGDRGYFRQDGCLVFMGRQDGMVKIRGFRVELETIEVALRKLPEVKTAAISSRALQGDDQHLIAYVVARSDALPSATVLRQGLAELLPDYMIPARFVFLDTLPLTPSGKIDRQALPPPGKARPDLETPFVAPRSELEQQIADIWAELLDLDQVGVDDNFFELGGDSILAMRMVLEVEQRLARQIPPEFFRRPTIGSLSSALQSDPAAGTVKAAERTPYSQQRSAPAPPPPAPRRRFWRRRTRIGILRRLRRPAENAIFNRAHDQVWRRLAQWCAAATRVGIYTPELDLLKRMQQALDNQMSISPTQRQACLMGNLLMQQWWRLPRASTTSSGMEVLQASTQPFWANLGYLLQHGAVEELDGQFSATGWEILKQAYQQRQGVILVSYHSPGLPFAMRAASRRIGGEPILTVVQYGGLQANKRGTQRASAIAGDVTAVTSERTVRAFQQLRRGGIIHFANDHGYTTDGTMGCPVAGRQYAFKPTFAEMAQATGAAIVPTLAFCTPSGQIHAVFLSPFSLPTTNSDSVRFAREALNQYVSFLAQSWRAYPESLLWSVIATHLQRPVSTPSE